MSAESPELRTYYYEVRRRPWYFEGNKVLLSGQIEDTCQVSAENRVISKARDLLDEDNAWYIDVVDVTGLE